MEERKRKIAMLEWQATQHWREAQSQQPALPPHTFQQLVKLPVVDSCQEMVLVSCGGNCTGQVKAPVLFEF